MKKYLWFIIAAFLAIPVFAKTTFEEANDFYIAENYKQAAETYMVIVKSGFVSPELYFNLGNSYFRLGDYPNAVLYYEKAKRLSPKDSDLLMNLGIVKTKITDKFETLPDIFFVRWWKNFAGVFSRDVWAIIFLCLVFTSVLCLAWYFLAMTSRGKQQSFWISFWFVICSITALSAAMQQHREQTKNMGVVMQNKVDVSSSPESGNLKMIIHGGTTVDILDEVGKYYRIRVPDGSNGWVPKATIAEV